MIRFSPSHLITVDAAAAGETPRRSISGVAVEWNQVAIVSSGEKVMFMPGSLPVDGRRPKLYMQHDPNQIIGQVTERIDTGEALMFTASISATELGNTALTLMSDGTLSEVSVGVDVIKFHYDKQDVMIIDAAQFNELSVVSQPAFSGSVITDVAASIPQTEPEISNNDQQVTEKESPMDTEVTPVVEAAAAVEKLWATPKHSTKIPTAPEYISAMMAGGARFAQVKEQLKAAAPAAPYIDTESNPGVLPEIIVQGVYNNFVGMRPVVDAFGPRPMPTGGQIFVRPKVSVHNSMGVQSAQNAALTSSTMEIERLTVTKQTYGGTVIISEQDMMWSTPEIIGTLLDDMARIYANTTDNVAADALVAGAVTTEAFGDPTLPEDWSAWLGASSQVILSASNGNLPNTLFVSPKYWGKLIALSDTTGRPLFPTLGPTNAMGTLEFSYGQGMAFGLNVVVDRNFTAETVILGCAGPSAGNPTGAGFECFELNQGTISVEVPSTLSRSLAMRGQFATLMIDEDKFVAASGL
jgi:HK97 family phage prohead protease